MFWMINDDDLTNEKELKGWRQWMKRRTNIPQDNTIA